MTVAMLMDNTVVSAERASKSTKEFIQLSIKSPVPSDIAIARSVTPKPIETILRELGVSSDEYQLYGRYKAKIELSILDRLESKGKYIVVSGYNRLFIHLIDC